MLNPQLINAESNLNPEQGAAAPFRRILLVTEGTEFDVGAERIGIELAASLDVQLLAVFPLFSNTEIDTLNPAGEEKAEAKAAARIDKLRQVASEHGMDLSGVVRRGQEPAYEVVAEAREKEADLIVVPRRDRRSYLANLLLGEMVHSVVSHTNCDVLTVPRAAQPWSKAIVLATDGSACGERATAVAAALAGRYDLPLTVLSIAEDHKLHGTGTDSSKLRIERALEVARAAGARATGREIPEGKPHQAILAAAQQADADLLVIGRRRLSHMERILSGSMCEKVASFSNVPVLIVQQDCLP